MRRGTTMIAIAALLAGCAGEQTGGDETSASDTAAVGTETAGTDAAATTWNARTDEGATGLSAVSVDTAGETLRIRPGPRAILWRASDSVSAPFTVGATFELVSMPERPEAFGLFVGGRDLTGAGQDYLYFLVRHDGRYLLKHRAGGETHTLVDWTEHEAVRSSSDAGGPPSNELGVRAGSEHLVFSANGQAVDSLPLAEAMVRASGFAGIRANHGLDLSVADFRVSSGAGSGGG